MRALLEHIRKKTIPHDMLEELYAGGVPFYDNCLIIEVHDHKSNKVIPQATSTNVPGGTKSEPFSIHNYNNFITPSPYVDYPIKPASDLQIKAEGAGKAASTTGTETVNNDKETDKENMPAPGQPASAAQKQAAKEKITTVVLFPTQMSHDVDIKLLANTPVPDIQTYRRNQSLSSNRGAGTPTMAHPPTPLTSVPPTPFTVSERSPKRQRMVLDESNVHEFEAEVIFATAPRLYLEPTGSLEESVALIDALTHSNYKNPPPAPKTRKRTTAELAADEAEAADTQRFMLAADERKISTAANASTADENQAGMRGVGTGFEPRFSRFKTLESIKMHHEENERRKKEEEARQAQMKRQQQAEAELQKRREMEASRQVEQNRAMQLKQDQLLHQQQQQNLQQQSLQQQHIQQQEALRAATQAQQVPNASAGKYPPGPYSQPQHSSPVVRQQTPMAASSPLINAHSMTSHSMASAPMAATSSSHAGSPPRPTSAVSHHPGVPMARNTSQQQSGQGVSRHGTPQVVQGTPIMNAAMPARNMTPQPRMNQQGSPNVGLQSTPVMMQTPQTQNYTPQQIDIIQRRQQIARIQQAQAAQQAAGIHNGSPNPQMSPEHFAAMRAQQIAAHGVPPNQNPAVYQQALARQMQQQMQNVNNAQMTTSAQNPTQMRPTASQPGAAITNQINLNSDSNTLKMQYAQRRQLIATRFQNNGQPVPPQFLQQMQTLQNAIRVAEAREAAGGGGPGAGGAQPGMSQPGVQGMNIAGHQTPNSAQQAVQMQQYQRILQQQRHAQQQQQLLAQMRAQGQIQGVGGVNGMNNMSTLINGGGGGMQQMGAGMNMQQMGNLGVGMNLQGMQGMAGMNGTNIQQMQNFQMMQRQAQAQGRGQRQPQQQQQQQQSQNDGGIEWSGM